MNSKQLRAPLRASLILASFLLVCGIAIAQNDQVKGVVNGRSGATMSVLSQGGESIAVVLTTDTQVLEPEGAFRKKHLTMTALVPGLAVEVKGSFNDKHHWLRTASRFTAQTLRPRNTSRLAWLRDSSRSSRISSKFKLTNRRFSSSNKNFKKKRQRPPPTKRRLQLPINASESC